MRRQSFGGRARTSLDRQAANPLARSLMALAGGAIAAIAVPPLWLAAFAAATESAIFRGTYHDEEGEVDFTATKNGLDVQIVGACPLPGIQLRLTPDPGASKGKVTGTMVRCNAPEVANKCKAKLTPTYEVPCTGEYAFYHTRNGTILRLMLDFRRPTVKLTDCSYKNPQPRQAVILLTQPSAGSGPSRGVIDVRGLLRRLFYFPEDHPLGSQR